MTKIEKLAQDIRKLNSEELSAFRKWFEEYEAEAWDRQIEQDARSGKLDKLAEEALAEHRQGRSKGL